MNLFFFLKPIRPVSNCGFNNQDFDWNIMHKEGMSGLLLLPERLEDLRLIFKAKSTGEMASYLVGSCGSWQSFQGRNEGCFP